MFHKYDADGKPITRDVSLECLEDVVTEQSHKDEVDINVIVRKHGIDITQQVADLSNFVFDDVTGNDFQESMNIIIKAQNSFGNIPLEIRQQFGHDPVKFLDFVQEKENKQQLIDWGLAEAPAPEPPPPVVADAGSGSEEGTA